MGKVLFGMLRQGKAGEVWRDKARLVQARWCQEVFGVAGVASPGLDRFVAV